MDTTEVLKVCFVQVPKAIGSFFLGLLLGILPAILYIFTFFGLALVRLPIDIFKTTKAAAKTVTLRPGLRILIILLLPIIHLLILLIVGCVFALLFFIVATSVRLFMRPCEVGFWLFPITQFPERIRRNWNAPVLFVDCEKHHVRQDCPTILCIYHLVSQVMFLPLEGHDTGVPANWDGKMYGIKVEGFTEETSNSYDLFWDHFTFMCLTERAELLEKKWIVRDDPSILLSISSVAILSIVANSVRKQGDDIEAIVLTNNVVWNSINRPKQDNILNVVWPRLVNVKKSLNKNAELAEQENIDIITAMVCSNQTDELKEYLDGMEKNKNYEDNKKICSKVMELSAMLTRFKPINDRLAEYRY